MRICGTTMITNGLFSKDLGHRNTADVWILTMGDSEKYEHSSQQRKIIPVNRVRRGLIISLKIKIMKNNHQ